MDQIKKAKVSFASDYIAGAHPKVLEALCKTNLEALTGYTTDIYCDSAKEKIKKACKKEDAKVYLLEGGTQTNAVVISSLLKSYEGVICAKSGHIAVHEAGAIEYTGHKVLTLPSYDGKISAKDLKEYIENFYADESYDHMVFPGMVYISHPTEYGTLYTKSEFGEIYSVCNENKLPLYVDGARLGYALASNETDVTLEDLAQLCDVFYIGGTKVGALCGEAVVFDEKIAPEHFITTVKQHGALIAKGRLLGVQFDALFTDNLYIEAGKHAVKLAEQLKRIFKDKGYKFFIDSPTNQQFVVLENKKIGQLREHVVFEIWEKYGECHSVARFVTSWSTTQADIDYLKEIL